MFKICLDLCGEELSGVEALDQRRILGLSETAGVFFAPARSGQRGARLATCEVSESFARAYFAPRATESTAKVPRVLLTQGDLSLCCEGNSKAVTFSDISSERIKELYLAVRFLGLKKEIERLTMERDV